MYAHSFVFSPLEPCLLLLWLLSAALRLSDIPKMCVLSTKAAYLLCFCCRIALLAQGFWDVLANENWGSNSGPCAITSKRKHSHNFFAQNYKRRLRMFVPGCSTWL